MTTKEAVKDTPAVEPGAVDETGKYTDEGLDALVESLKKDPEVKEEVKDVVEEEEQEEEEKKTKREKMIPRSRFDEVVQENQRLKASQMKQATTGVPTLASLRTDLKKARSDWQQAIFDNDAKAASTFLSLIDTIEENIDQARDDTTTSVARALTSDDIKYDNLLDNAMKEYDVINKASDDYDQTVVNEMVEMRESYIARGYSQADALQQSIKYILKPHKSAKTVKDVTDTRKTSARKNTVDALKRQPSNVADLGGATDTGGPGNVLGIDITRLTIEQFDRLPDDVKAKLRGDTITDEHLDKRRA